MPDLENILQSNSLDEVNRLLSGAMAKQQIQALIKGENLENLVQHIVTLSAKSEPEESLKNAAVLARLAAVARNRSEEIFEDLEKVIVSRPSNIDDLADGDEKFYAAKALGYLEVDWLFEYCVAQAVQIDTADAARKQLLLVALENSASVGAWLATISASTPSESEFSNVTSYVRRVRRILAAIVEILREHDFLHGQDLGERILRYAVRAFKKECKAADEDVLFSALDLFLLILVRIIEVRFSLAMYGSTYKSLESLKRSLGPGLWAKFLRSSESINKIRSILCESSLVLARQGKTDNEILSAMLSSFVSRPQLKSALGKHFEGAEDVEGNIGKWWLSAGEEKGTDAQRIQPMSNNEDRQIGELLLQIESHHSTMKALPVTVVPILKMHDEVAAATVKRAANAFVEMAQIIRRLGRMRRLSKTDLKEDVVEYSPREHEMLGGHQHGVRMVRVVRDGIKKDFDGSVRFLSKPQVEPYE